MIPSYSAFSKDGDVKSIVPTFPSYFSFMQAAHLAPSFNFLPDFTEHPKPQRRKTQAKFSNLPPPSPPNGSGGGVSSAPTPPPAQGGDDDDIDESEVTFAQDFIAGGMAGSASIIVGHPFDTVKVRVQSSTGGSVLSTLAEFGGISSLFRGMAAPLSSAAAINAVVFSSYGVASKLYDQNFPQPEDDSSYDGPELNHDPWPKSMTCGAFAGFVQCFIICPMEHIKCRLQVQHGKGSADHRYKGPVQALKSIVKEHGVSRLFQGWWVTLWREVPAFGLYFVTYDFIKDKVNTYFAKRAAKAGVIRNETKNEAMGFGHSHTWLASAVAGGCAGCFTWGIVYPLDMVKTRIQTSPLTTPRSELKLLTIAKMMVEKHGWRYLFRGFSVTIVRAFPVNGTLFPVYEFTLLQLKKYQSDRQ